MKKYRIIFYTSKFHLSFEVYSIELYAKDKREAEMEAKKILPKYEILLTKEI